MKLPFHKASDELAGRRDLAAIAKMVPEGARVLDVGCGDGVLLDYLGRSKRVDGRGIELEIDNVRRCVARGLSVVQGDADTDLQHYPDRAFDLVILSKALQAMQQPREVLVELVRIGRQAVVSIPNFGHWRNRLYLMARGRMPVTATLRYEWYDTPNIHFCTIRDFVGLCEAENIVIRRRFTLNHQGRELPFRGHSLTANLFGEVGLFLLERK